MMQTSDMTRSGEPRNILAVWSMRKDGRYGKDPCGALGALCSTSRAEPPRSRSARRPAAARAAVERGATGKKRHLSELRPFDRNRILDDIDAHLRSSPAIATARRKMLVGATPSFEHVQPVWQLRVGEFRVIYDVDGNDHVVTVRAVLHKGNKTTGEIL